MAVLAWPAFDWDSNWTVDVDSRNVQASALLASSGALVAIPLAWIVFEDVTTHDIWDWSSTMTAEVIVLDDKLGLPIEDASVSITWSIVDPDGADAFTDAAGVANYSKDWPYGGRSSGRGLLYGGRTVVLQTSTPRSPCLRRRL